MKKIVWPDLTFPPINLWTVWKMRKALSPCKNECLFDKRLGFCSSCGRTMQEISNWNKFSDKMKQDIKFKANERLGLKNGN